MQTLEQQLTEIERYIPLLKEENLAISKVSVAWQADHLLRVISSIVRALEQSDPIVFKAKFNFWRSLFLALNYLPRGKGRAPKKVIPTAEINESGLRQQLSFARDNTLQLEKLPALTHFSHPVFGELNKSQAKKFIRIHTEHHLKIIRDILKN